ncbi:MAG TPA: hypothetical protein VMQ61_08730 [Thermoanaerobaculia bacterium]|nr:hypothetical protein [Thermoanaerobaculia bacterium]
MRQKIHARCAPRCGVEIHGEFDAETRELIHRFTLPLGAEALLKTPRTEVERSRLATFAPDSKDWFVICPVCDASIRIELPETPA